jgi:uncharacterized protein (DUF433 family)
MKDQATVELAGLITRSPGVRGGRPVIAGTGVTVKRIAAGHRLGIEPETIAAEYGHLNLAQVHAALSYCFANREAIDADLAEEEAEFDRLSEMAKRGMAA